MEIWSEYSLHTFPCDSCGQQKNVTNSDQGELTITVATVLCLLLLLYLNTCEFLFKHSLYKSLFSPHFIPIFGP